MNTLRVLGQGIRSIIKGDIHIIPVSEIDEQSMKTIEQNRWHITSTRALKIGSTYLFHFEQQ